MDSEMTDMVRPTPPCRWRQPFQAPAAVAPAVPARRAVRRVLLVDGDADSRAILGAALRHSGVEVVQARTGEEAIGLALAAPPDLVILELRLRGGSGMSVLEALRADPCTSAVPVLVRTTHTDQETRDRARAAGCAGFVTESVSPTRLAAEIVTGATSIRAMV